MVLFNIELIFLILNVVVEIILIAFFVLLLNKLLNAFSWLVFEFDLESNWIWIKV